MTHARWASNRRWRCQPGGPWRRVTSHLLFHFKDASVHEETVVLSQRHSFRLISDHLVQKGSIFKNPVDVSINGLTGQFKVNYADDDGKKKTVTEV
jgi:hypothetical protein